MTAAALGVGDFCGTSSMCYRFLKRPRLTMGMKKRIAYQITEIMEYLGFKLGVRKEIESEMSTIGYE